MYSAEGLPVQLPSSSHTQLQKKFIFHSLPNFDSSIWKDSFQRVRAAGGPVLMNCGILSCSSLLEWVLLAVTTQQGGLLEKLCYSSCNCRAPIPCTAHSSPGRRCFLAAKWHLLSLVWTHGPAFPREKHRPGCQARPAQLLHPSPRLWGREALTGKAKHTRHAPGKEGSQGCGGQLDEMACVKFSSATIFTEQKDGSGSLIPV